MSVAVIRPDWPAPPRVQACVSLRSGGVSKAAYASLNLGMHVGDTLSSVATNRRRLRAALELPDEPCWLSQVHGTRVVELGPARGAGEADAAFTRLPGIVCCVQTADCLPVLLTDRVGSLVGIAHAGWRGLAAGVIEATVMAMAVDPAGLLAWLGPAISQPAYEVGPEVRAACLARDPAATAAFEANARGRWQADLYELARQALACAGVAHVFGGSYCTYSEPQRFFSHRRSAPCGRHASLIWLTPDVSAS